MGSAAAAAQHRRCAHRAVDTLGDVSPGVLGRCALVPLVGLVPIHIAFLAIMAALGAGVARLARLDVPRSRALVFRDATKNSLVILPLASRIRQARG